MFPGMNPRDLQKAMKRMGIKQQEVNAEQVIIKCSDKTLIFDNPEVLRINMMGQENFQITGSYRTEEAEETPEINEEDIKTVVAQTNVDEETAKKTLIKNNGDIAKTIIELRS